MKPEDSSLCIQSTKIGPSRYLNPLGEYSHLLKVTLKPRAEGRYSEPVYIAIGLDDKDCTVIGSISLNGSGVLDLLESAAFLNSERLFA